MKFLALKIITLLLFSIASASCGRSAKLSDHGDFTPNSDSPQTVRKMKITVNNQVFNATLENNATALAFQQLLPLTLEMSDLNSNEKYADLPKSLPTAASHPGTIQNGDIMLFGSQTLVVFYESFNTAYSYSKIGKIEQLEGFKASLGNGNVLIKFELD